MVSTMDRRSFLLVGAAAVSCPLCAQSKYSFKGCNLAAAPGSMAILERLHTSGDSKLDLLCQQELPYLAEFFEVRAAFGFFDDTDGANALALNKIDDINFSDGTVLFGVGLAKQYLKGERDFIIAVMAHEWAHIEQYKKNEKAAWAVKYELFADFRAGQYCQTRFSDGELAAQLFHRLGNSNFSHPDYHGAPEQRSDMFRTGFGITTDIEKDTLGRGIKGLR